MFEDSSNQRLDKPFEGRNQDKQPGLAKFASSENR
jgi:hypothetical protein